MFVENLRHGQGILLWKKFGHAVLCFAAVDSLLNRSPSKYVGEFVDGFPKGKGYYKSADGQKIEGEFSWAVARKEPDGEFTGLLSDDLKYGYGFGSFSTTEINHLYVSFSSYGIKKFENGNSYEGEWFNGKYQGFGEYTRGTIVPSTFSRLRSLLLSLLQLTEPHLRAPGSRTCSPALASSDGPTATSLRANGMPPIGSCFQILRDFIGFSRLVNKREGLGSMKFSSTGVEVECKWKDNAMTNPVVYRWSDGRSFHGDLVDDKPHGLGTLFVPSTDEKAPGVDKYTLTWEKGTL